MYVCVCVGVGVNVWPIFSRRKTSACYFGIHPVPSTRPDPLVDAPNVSGELSGNSYP